MKGFAVPCIIVFLIIGAAFMNAARCSDAADEVISLLKSLPDDPENATEGEIDEIVSGWEGCRDVFSLVSRTDYVHAVSRGIVNLKAAQKAKEKDSFAMTKESLIYDLIQLSEAQSPSLGSVLG